MPDEWESIRARLGKLGLGSRREQEIVRELSEHLGDHAAALEARGVEEDAAVRQALDSAVNWPELRRQIVLAETEEATMNFRTKAVWLPALWRADPEQWTVGADADFRSRAALALVRFHQRHVRLT